MNNAQPWMTRACPSLSYQATEPISHKPFTMRGGIFRTKNTFAANMMILGLKNGNGAFGQLKECDTAQC
jgi:hypothetical protein